VTTGCSCTTPGCPVPSPRPEQPCHVHTRHPELGPEPHLWERVLDSLRSGFYDAQLGQPGQCLGAQVVPERTREAGE
jgi:hypothetical protein